MLTVLDLHYNDITPFGATALAHVLKVNTTLTSLDMSYNGAGDPGAYAFCRAMRENSTLTDLNLSHNSVSPGMMATLQVRSGASECASPPGEGERDREACFQLQSAQERESMQGQESFCPSLPSSLRVSKKTRAETERQQKDKEHRGLRHALWDLSRHDDARRTKLRRIAGAQVSTQSTTVARAARPVPPI